MSILRVSDGGNHDVYVRVSGAGSTTDPFSFDYEPPYEVVKVLTLADSGTILAGVAGSAIVVEYHTQQNVGTTTPTLSLLNGTVPFQTHQLSYLGGQNFASFSAPAPGREWRMDEGEPLVLSFSAAGSVITNTRYWYEAAS